MQRRGIGRQPQPASSGSTPHDRVTIPQICPSRSPALERPRQSAPRYPPPAANRPTIYRVRYHPPLISQPLHRRTTRCIGSIQIRQLARGTQITIAPAALLYVPQRGFLVWDFLSRCSPAANLLSFVSFFVRSQSPFLRPDPRFAGAVARRSRQGWPPRQPCGMLRGCQATP